MKKILPVLLIFLLASPPMHAAGGGGGGDSGGGGGYGGGGGSSTLEFTATKNSIDKILQTGDYYTLKLKDKSSYDVFIRSQDAAEILLVVVEPFQEFSIPLSSSAEIDLNQDGITDILVEVKGAIVPGKSTQIEIKDTFERKPIQEKQPAAAQQQAGLLCGDKPSRKERVQCRLDLEEEEFEYEYNLRFLPEECIPLEGSKKARCINIYQSVQQCWKFKEDAARVSCVKNQIRFTNARDEIQKCVLLQPKERSACIENVKENVYTIIKFKFYNLEEKAEELLEEGKVSQDNVAAFITEIEGKKIEFNNAATIAEKRQIISQVNKLWKEFLATSQPE